MFENKIDYYENNKDFSGFKKKLTDYQQKAQVTKHILGHAGIILAGRGFDSNFDIRNPQTKDTGPMGIGTFIGYLGSGAAELSDWLQRLIEKRQESISEINDNQAARKVANEFKKAFLKQISRDQLQRNLYNLLGE